MKNGSARSARRARDSCVASRLVRERRARCERPPANQPPTGRIESTVSRTTRRARRERLARENDSDVFRFRIPRPRSRRFERADLPTPRLTRGILAHPSFVEARAISGGGLISPITTRRGPPRGDHLRYVGFRVWARSFITRSFVRQCVTTARDGTRARERETRRGTIVRLDVSRSHARSRARVRESASVGER